VLILVTLGLFISKGKADADSVDEAQSRPVALAQ
jgi:hypothetical protein